MKTNWAKALPASALAFTLCLAAGCSSDSDSDCEIKASVDAVVTSADQLVAVAADMRGKLYVACSNIAGMDGAKASDATDEKVQTACDAAKAKLDATITGSVSLTYVPGKCEVDAQAQLDCEAKCKSDVMCTEPSIEARCEGGKVSVECSGECTGTVTCEGSATVAALDGGVHALGKKILEEAGEVWLAAEHESDEALAEEISQLLYWAQVLMVARGLTLDDIYNKL